MDGDLYRILLFVLQGMGFLISGVYLFLHQPYRWKTPASRDHSGWILWANLIYAVLLWRLFTSTAPIPDGQLIARLTNLVFLLALNAFIVNRLIKFLQARADERRNPSKRCPCCGGEGVVPLNKEVCRG